jgi:hypothetical protein
VPALRAYLDEVMASGILRMTDGARRVADLFGDPPRDVPQRPLWLLRASLLGLRLGRPLAHPGSASSPPPSWPAGAWRAATDPWPKPPPTGPAVDRPAVLRT